VVLKEELFDTGDVRDAFGSLELNGTERISPLCGECDFEAFEWSCVLSGGGTEFEDLVSYQKETTYE
jgi:hypothetical protein